jgi:hypothetical protein
LSASDFARSISNEHGRTSCPCHPTFVLVPKLPVGHALSRSSRFTLRIRLRRTRRAAVSKQSFGGPRGHPAGRASLSWGRSLGPTENRSPNGSHSNRLVTPQVAHENSRNASRWPSGRLRNSIEPGRGRLRLRVRFEDCEPEQVERGSRNDPTEWGQPHNEFATNGWPCGAGPARPARLKS